MMDINHEEQFQWAYVHAVASAAGFTLYQPAVDDDSIDLGVAGGIAHYMPRPACASDSVALHAACVMPLAVTTWFTR